MKVFAVILGLATQIAMPASANDPEEIASGTVTLTDDCHIAGGETVFGLTFDPVYMKLK